MSDFFEAIRALLHMVTELIILFIGIGCLLNKQFELGILLLILVAIFSTHWYICQIYQHIRSIDLSRRQ